MKTSTATLTGALAALTFLVVGVANAQFAAPVVTDISSPEPGTVEFTLAPVENGHAAIFLIYRQQGIHSTPDGFEVLKRSGYPHRVFDTAGSPEVYKSASGIALRISGLKSGMASFYVVQTDGGAFNPVESAPSNIMSVVINGNNTADGAISSGIRPLGASAVPPDKVVEEFTAYPNPTASLVYLGASGSNAASVRLFNAYGTELQGIEPIIKAGGLALDVGGLPVGAYYAVVTRGEKIINTRFTVLR